MLLSFAKLPQAFHGLRVVQFSDIHYGFHFGQEQLLRLVDKINLLQADLICMTGDLYDSSIGSDAQEVIGALAKLNAPLGKWAVVGIMIISPVPKKSCRRAEDSGV